MKGRKIAAGIFALALCLVLMGGFSTRAAAAEAEAEEAAVVLLTEEDAAQETTEEEAAEEEEEEATTPILRAPTLKKIKTVVGGTKLYWRELDGADGYAVLRRKSGGDWQVIGYTKAGKTTYTDTEALKNGKVYYYTVRAYQGKASAAKASYGTEEEATYWGDYNEIGLKNYYLKAPTVKSVSISSSKYVEITWSKVKKASGYALYRKKNGGKWELIKTTTDTSYIDKDTLTNHKTYSYRVVAYTGKKAAALSNYPDPGYWGCISEAGKIDIVKNSDGTLISDTAMYTQAQSFDSDTKWLILVNCSTNKVGIFYGSKGNWSLRYYWSCTTGKSSSPTVKGTFKVSGRGIGFDGDYYTCWYYTQFYGNYLFHSVLYAKGSQTSIVDGRLGQNLSHGCVRLSMTNAKWIYNNIPNGTKVYIY